MAVRMAAWRLHAYGAPNELRLEAARRPPLRAPDDVLVRVQHASVNPLDCAMLRGYGAAVLNAVRALDGGGGVEFPLVPGRDFVGRVERAGAGASLRRGQRVWGVVPPHRPGAHAEYVLVKDRWAGPAPERLGAAAGGALFAALSATAALRAAGVRGRAAAGARVLLLGLGGVGQAALQVLVHDGAQVVVGCSGDLCELATALGAVAAFDRHAEDYERLLREAGPYTAAVDCAGLGGAAAGAALWRCARFATLSSPLLRETDARGLAAGAAAAALALARHNAQLAAHPAPAACPPRVRWAYFAPDAGDIELLRRLAERGEFAVAVQRSFALRELPSALLLAEAGSARGKLLVAFGADGEPT